MTQKRPDGKRDLSGEDLGLWQQVTRDLKPLKRRDQPSRSEPTTDPSPPRAAKSETRFKLRAGASALACEQTAPKPLTPGMPHGIDRRTADRLKRGKLPVEARLDLHGLTQRQAERALSRFLAESQAAGRRNVLLITGKGRNGETGVLRREVPRWLNQPGNRDRVVAVSPARPKDGGAGALYLRLRRLRER